MGSKRDKPKKISPFSAEGRAKKLNDIIMGSVRPQAPAKPKPKAPKKEKVKATTGDKYTAARNKAIADQQKADRDEIKRRGL